jgi:hypothetical protein
MPKAKPKNEEQEPQVEECRVSGCGGILNEDRFCKLGQGYPLYIQRQSTVCPHCRKGLNWQGHCPRCWGRYEQTGPGYYFEEVNGHWQNTGEKERLFDGEEIGELMADISSTLSRGFSEVVPF